MRQTKHIWSNLDGARVVPLPRCKWGYLDFDTVQGGVDDGHNGTWSISPSLRCQRHVNVAAQPGTRAWRLIESLASIKGVRFGGYSKHIKAWRCLPNIGEDFQKLYALGWDTSPITGELIAPKR